MALCDHVRFALALENGCHAVSITMAVAVKTAWIPARGTKCPKTEPRADSIHTDLGDLDRLLYQPVRARAAASLISACVQAGVQTEIVSTPDSATACPQSARQSPPQVLGSARALGSAGLQVTVIGPSEETKTACTS